MTQRGDGAVDSCVPRWTMWRRKSTTWHQDGALETCVFLIFIYIYIFFTKYILYPFFFPKYHKIIQNHIFSCFCSKKKSDVRSFSTFNDLGLRLLAMGCIQASRQVVFNTLLISCLTVATVSLNVVTEFIRQFLVAYQWRRNHLYCILYCLHTEYFW